MCIIYVEITPIGDHERRKWQNPEAILSSISLRPGFTFIDIGCGGGFFALPAARIVGKRGKVYGLDTDAESIASLKERATREGLKNLYLTTGRAEESVICEQCAVSSSTCRMNPPDGKTELTREIWGNYRLFRYKATQEP